MNPSGIKIEVAENEKQIEDVKLLLREYAEQRNYDAALGDFEKELKELTNKYALPEGVLLIAYWNDSPAGCVALHQFEEGVCEMKRLFVSQKHRGLKVGVRLVKVVLDFAKKLNYQKILLDTHPSMTIAQTIYRREGFKEIEAYHFNPTKGIRFFEKELN